MEILAQRPFLVSRTQPERLAAFAAAVAHDVNNELTVILSSVTGLLREVEPGHPVRESLREVERAAMRCAGITDGLLEMTRREGACGTIPLDRFLAS